MYFVYIYDIDHSSEHFFEKLQKSVQKTNDVLKPIATKNGVPLDKRHVKAFDILLTETKRAPIFIDAFSAKYHYDLLFAQNDICVVFPHEMDLSSDVSNSNPFTEKDAAAFGVPFIYIDETFSESRNNKILPVVDVKDGCRKFDDIYAEFREKYLEEHIFYPSFFCLRSEHENCLGRMFSLIQFIVSGVKPNSRIQPRKVEFPVDTQTIDLMLLNIVSISKNNKQIPLQIKL